jgi:hypothetical protein
MRRASTSVVLVALLFATAATAQTITISPRADAPTAVTAPPLRIQTSIQIALPASSVEDEAKAMESARRQLYQSANNECAILSDIFKADCRLVSANANSSTQERGVSGPSINAHLNASYELSPRSR